jgi:hypothetical protein
MFPVHRIALYAACGISVLAAVDVALAQGAGLESATPAMRAAGWATMFLVLYWMLTHPRLPARLKPTFDHGLFLWASFPLAVAHHIFVLYRWRGVPILAGILALVFLPELTSLVVFVVS